MSDTPKKTLTLKRPGAGDAASPGTVTRGGKRIIRRAELPGVSKARSGKPAAKGGQKKPARQPASRKPLISPSERKARELNDRLNGFPVWLNYQPLAIGVDKDVYRLVNDEQFPGASKRVVQKVLRRHTRQARYLQALAAGGARFHLDGTEDS